MAASGTYPALQVSFAPGIASSAVPAGGDWVDVSAYVLSLASKTGREDEFTQPAAGSMHLELDNSTGRFDPDNSSGPYYSQLLPLVWFRLKGGTTTANTDTFYGQVSIEGFRLQASQFPSSVVSVDILDMFEQMANTELPGSVWVYTLRQYSPSAWWRLGESSGTVAVDSSASGIHGTYEGGATFNSRSGLIAYDSDKSIGFDGVDDYVSLPVSLTNPTVLAGDSVHVAFSIPTVSTTGLHPLVALPGAYASGAYVAVYGTDAGADAGKLYMTKQGAFKKSTSRVDDGTTHFAIARFTADAELYVDGVDETTAASAETVDTSGVARIGADGNGRYTAATIDEVAVLTLASSADALTLYSAATAPWNGELSGARVTHLLDAASFPSSLRTVATGVSAMAPTSLSTDLLSALQAVAKAEGGELYVDHTDAGKVRFRGRRDRWTASASITSQATFGDGGGTEVPYSAIALQDDRIINSASVQRFGGSTVLVEDATSKATYQRRGYSETGLLLDTDTDVIYRAQAIVAAKKDRHRRVRSITLEPRADTHPAWAQVFARKIGDQITVKWRPPYGGTYSFPCWIEGIAHAWDQERAEWRTVFYTSPVPFGASGAPYWIWDTSTWETGTSVARWAY